MSTRASSVDVVDAPDVRKRSQRWNGPRVEMSERGSHLLRRRKQWSSFCRSIRMCAVMTRAHVSSAVHQERASAPCSVFSSRWGGISGSRRHLTLDSAVLRVTIDDCIGIPHRPARSPGGELRPLRRKVQASHTRAGHATPLHIGIVGSGAVHITLTVSSPPRAGRPYLRPTRAKDAPPLESAAPGDIWGL